MQLKNTDRFKNIVEYHGQQDKDYITFVLELCEETRMPHGLTAILSPKDKQITLVVWLRQIGRRTSGKTAMKSYLAADNGQSLDFTEL